MLCPFVGLTLIIIKFPSTPSTIHLAFLCENQRAPRKADQMMPQANLKEVEVWSGLFIVPGSVLSQDTDYPHSRWGWWGNCQERWFLSAGPVIFTLIWRCLSCCSFPINSISLRFFCPPEILPCSCICFFILLDTPCWLLYSRWNNHFSQPWRSGLV